MRKLVDTLETRHDSYMEDNPLPSPLMGADGEIPHADDIAQELQNFLAKRGDRDAPDEVVDKP